MTKICHLLLSLNAGGMENGIINVTSCLPVDAFSTDILCIGSLGEMTKRLPESVNVECLHYQSGFHWKGVWQIAKYIRRTKYKIYIRIIQPRLSEED